MKIIIGETAITLEHARAALAGPVTVSLSPKARGSLSKALKRWRGCSRPAMRFTA